MRSESCFLNFELCVDKQNKKPRLNISLDFPQTLGSTLPMANTTTPWNSVLSFISVKNAHKHELNLKTFGKIYKSRDVNLFYDLYVKLLLPFFVLLPQFLFDEKLKGMTRK